MVTDIFDWVEYVKLYEDLVKANIDTKEKALIHWNEHGKYESRIYPTYPMNILHILHNYGGGTEVYIDNMINIFSKHNHIKHKIQEDNIFTIPENINLIFVHHLLYHKNDKRIINKDIVENLAESKIPKLLIVHDYFMFYPNDPNPIFIDMQPPIKNNINYTNYFFGIFDKVIFNSTNTYEQHSKYLNIENKIILNVVPDIDTNKTKKINNEKNESENNKSEKSENNNLNVCDESDKNEKNENNLNGCDKNEKSESKSNLDESNLDKNSGLVFGLLGNIGCEHKGCSLASKIFDLCGECSFKVFGEYGGCNSNVSVLGKYVNDDIFELIYKHKINAFLFVSRFPETYSFCLSIALKTGLPIVYNNIGAYTERLKNYDNCYPFDETNITTIKNIIDKINKYNYCSDISNYNIYPNMPELSNYLQIDDLFNWNLDFIKVNNIHKDNSSFNVCFIHVCSAGNGNNIFEDQIDYIKKSGLYDKLDYIFVTLLGEHVKIYNDRKIKLIYYSPNGEEWEFPTMKRIKHFSNNFPNANILYIHTKGVLGKAHSYEWRKYLEYFLVEKHNLCISALNSGYQCVGVNKQIFPYTRWSGKNADHFSGNFWWSKSSYIANLNMISDKRNDRYLAEHYLIGNNTDYRYFLSLHNTRIDFYQEHLEKNEYEINVCNNVLNKNIFGVYFICCIGDYMNIVREQLMKLIVSGLYEKSEKIFCFICGVTENILKLLKPYNKILVISTSENLYEKYAINNYKNYIGNNDYYLYYFHTKAVTRKEKCFKDWRLLCEHFTINKWNINIKLLERYDCVGTNLKNFPSIHFSGNFWWSKSEHLNKLSNIDDKYLSPEMYICSSLETNYVSIYQSNVTHGNTEYDEEKYMLISDNTILENIVIVPDFNEGDKNVWN